MRRIYLATYRASTPQVRGVLALDGEAAEHAGSLGAQTDSPRDGFGPETRHGLAVEVRGTAEENQRHWPTPAEVDRVLARFELNRVAVEATQREQEIFDHVSYPFAAGQSEYDPRNSLTPSRQSRDSAACTSPWPVTSYSGPC